MQLRPRESMGLAQPRVGASGRARNLTQFFGLHVQNHFHDHCPSEVLTFLPKLLPSSFLKVVLEICEPSVKASIGGKQGVREGGAGATSSRGRSSPQPLPPPGHTVLGRLTQ